MADTRPSADAVVFAIALATFLLATVGIGIGAVFLLRDLVATATV